MKRPPYIKHYSELSETDGDNHYPGSEELLSIGSPMGRGLGLTRVGIHHELLPPGRRTSWPHAESLEEEFVYVLEGNPQVWLDGELCDLSPGDAVAFPSGTGIAHCVINNTQLPVRLLVVGEKRSGNQCYYPKHPSRKSQIGNDWWDGTCNRLGSHDGLPDKLR